MKPLSWVETHGSRGTWSRVPRAANKEAPASLPSPPRTWTQDPARAHPQPFVGLLGPGAWAAKAWQALCYQLQQLSGMDWRLENTGAGRRGTRSWVGGWGAGTPAPRSANAAKSPSRLPLQRLPAPVGLQGRPSRPSKLNVAPPV